MTTVLNAPLLTSGLRKKPTYEEAINYIENDKDKIHYPDRKAKFLRNTFELSQLDGMGMQIMEAQQLREMKEREKIHYLREIANNSGSSYKLLKANQDQQEEKTLIGPPSVSHDMTAADDGEEFTQSRETVEPEIPEAPHEQVMSRASASTSPPIAEGFDRKDWTTAELRALAVQLDVRVWSNDTKVMMYRKLRDAGINPNDYKRRK